MQALSPHIVHYRLTIANPAISRISSLPKARHNALSFYPLFKAVLKCKTRIFATLITVLTRESSNRQNNQTCVGKFVNRPPNQHRPHFKIRANPFVAVVTNSSPMDPSYFFVLPFLLGFFRLSLGERVDSWSLLLLFSRSIRFPLLLDVCAEWLECVG